MARRLVALVLLACSACLPGPKAFCDQLGTTNCAKVYACATTQAEKDALATLYGSESKCVELLRTRLQCATIDESRSCNGRGTSAWDGAAANRCLSDVRALSCTQVTSSFTLPDACNALCKP